MDNQQTPTPIPEIFWSFETGVPMHRCSLCNGELMHPGTHYLIEKAFKNGETIFEHALCLDCHAITVNEMSTDSMQAIRTYFSNHVDMEKRHATAMQEYGTDHRKWIAHCLIKGYPAQECGEYQLYGFCNGDQLSFNGAPYILSGEAIDEITELLSSETVEALGDLSDRLFGLDAPKDLLIF